MPFVFILFLFCFLRYIQELHGDIQLGYSIGIQKSTPACSDKFISHHMHLLPYKAIKPPATSSKDIIRLHTGFTSFAPALNSAM